MNLPAGAFTGSKTIETVSTKDTEIKQKISIREMPDEEAFEEDDALESFDKSRLTKNNKRNSKEKAVSGDDVFEKSNINWFLTVFLAFIPVFNIFWLLFLGLFKKDERRGYALSSLVFIIISYVAIIILTMKAWPVIRFYYFA